MFNKKTWINQKRAERIRKWNQKRGIVCKNCGKGLSQHYSVNTTGLCRDCWRTMPFSKNKGVGWRGDIEGHREAAAKGRTKKKFAGAFK